MDCRCSKTTASSRRQTSSGARGSGLTSPGSTFPVFGDEDEPTEPLHQRGIVAGEPGLSFVGLFFLYAMSSEFLPGVGRDAEHVVNDIATRHNVIRRQTGLNLHRTRPTDDGFE